VDGDRIKNEKLQQCIAIDEISDGKLVPWEFKPYSPARDKENTKELRRN
jgi:hypothetical protein